MAGILNSVYLAIATVVVLAGLLVVAKAMDDADLGEPRWADWPIMVVGAVFLVVLAVRFLT